jgi:NAD(P) transhydrogenase subunit alpha
LGLSVGVVKETIPGERRVALTPKVIEMLTKVGAEVWIESGAGVESGYPDDEYTARGAKIGSLADVRGNTGILLTVRAPQPEGLKKGQIVIGFCDPLSDPEIAARYAGAGLTLISMELVPRITRAQSMDALSSMASIAGYKAVLVAAVTLPRLFPMMTTAAGTIPPARVLILGAGVAGLQAIATARRLGAVVSGYDVRAAVKEQIESLGAKFVSIDIGAAGEGQGGYARALTEEEIRSQREQMAKVIKEQDVVITTAAVPGRKAPILVTREMALGMNPGSVIVDIAAERGGNCELTRAGETVIENGISIVGPVNLPATVPGHASQMYARNIVTLLKNMLTKQGELNIDTADEITRESLVVRDGEVVNPRVQALLGAPVKS